MQRCWEVEGDGFKVTWGDRDWRLRVDNDQPGLSLPGSPGMYLLGLEGVAEAGRFDASACSGATLLGVEFRRHRVIASYSPPGWGQMFIRAAWSLAGDQAIDLELQLNAQSVGELSAVEVLTASRVGGAAEAKEDVVVTPRDATSAALSYDGRESALSRLLTRPPRPIEQPPCWVVRDPSEPSWYYAEFAHPHDESRHMLQDAASVRHGFFGYDLEKGVVLRARLRGFWVKECADRLALIEHEHASFLSQPLPLTT